MLNYIFHYIKSLFVEGFCFLSCLILKGIIIKHTWSLFWRHEPILKRKLKIVIDIRKAPDRVINKKAIYMPYDKQLNWNNLLLSLAHKNQGNCPWRLVIISNNETELKALEATLKRGCKMKKSKLRYPSVVHYSLESNLDTTLNQILSVAKKSNIQL